MQKLKMHSFDMIQDNIAHIRTRFPNCVTEAHDSVGKVVYKVDFDLLRQELANELVEGPQERYRLDWPGKRQSILAANIPITKSLRPCWKENESVNFSTTENIYIEGDNLEALKLLQESYLGKIKMIYIDPPYNTGNDFIYKDDFAEDSRNFLHRDGQYDNDKNRMVQNLESNGRFHSDWLSMIYQRLRIARNLLTDNGAIFISIDDNEIDNLKKICNEIFGMSNFIAIINWKGRGGRQDSRYYAAVHEYILCYAKMKNYFHAGEEIKSGDVYPKYDEKKNRYYKTQLLRKWGSNSHREDRPNLFYPIQAPDGSDVYPMLSGEADQRPSNLRNMEGRWRWGISTMEKALKEGDIEFIKQVDGSWVPYEKIYAPTEGEEKTKKYTTWLEDSNDGTNIIKGLFENVVFDYPKAPSLVMKFLKMANVGDNDIILDFFSGSATTAHAVMQLNVEDGGKRKFIMIQWPEVAPSDSEAAKAGYKNICEIGKERIRRAGKKIKEEQALSAQNLDIGFRVLKVQPSCMANVYYMPDEATQDALDLKVDNVNPGTPSEDILFQVLTDWGVELHLPIAVKDIKNKKVFFVDENSLVACFERGIDDDFIKEVAGYKPIRIVFRDSGFANDAARINAEQIFKQLSPDTEVRVL